MSDNESILHLDVNLGDIEDFEPLPEGYYPAEVREAEKRISGNGNEYYYQVFHIHPDDYPADYDVENNPDGTPLVYALLQVPRANNRRSLTAVKRYYRAIGLDLATSDINPADWIGQKAKLQVVRDTYNGEPIARIAAIEALD